MAQGARLLLLRFLFLLSIYPASEAFAQKVPLAGA